MNVLLNNCRRRDHASLFGKTAFFDLNTFGLQASMAANLARGQKCIVASYDDDGNVLFEWYVFEKETPEKDPDDQTISVRVFRGKKLKSETMSKKEAVRSEQYSAFFNVKGDFKRPSVIK